MNFETYRKCTNKYRSTRDFKEYVAEEYDEIDNFSDSLQKWHKKIRNEKIKFGFSFLISLKRLFLTQPLSGRLSSKEIVNLRPLA